MITALRRRDGVMGPTLNIDATLRFDDGAQAVAGRLDDRPPDGSAASLLAQ
jgi:hypothetical protein